MESIEDIIFIYLIGIIASITITLFYIILKKHLTNKMVKKEIESFIENYRGKIITQIQAKYLHELIFKTYNIIEYRLSDSMTLVLIKKTCDLDDCGKYLETIEQEFNSFLVEGKLGKELNMTK